MTHVKVNWKSVIAGVFLIFAAFAQAADFSDMAEVVSTQPITRQVAEMHQSCTNEVVQESAPAIQQQKSYAGPVVGAITGSIIGNQVGRGDGKTAATAIGAAIGAMVGDSMSNQPQSQYQTQSRTVQRCQPYTIYREVTAGYVVTYKYNGKIGQTTTQNHPGDLIRIGVSAQ